MHTLVEGTHAVPGASLHYQVRGAGPALLLMSGGHGDANSFDGMAAVLAEHFTVVSYDRRGYARSPLVDPAAPQTVATHGDDAAALLRAVANGPAYVFGTSAGAVVGLDLVARHPGLARTLVAHEPPVVRLLPPTERPAPPVELLEQLRVAGPVAAMDTFRAMLGVDLDDGEPDAEPQPQDPARARANATFFFTREAPALDQFTPDLAALKASPVHLIPAGGTTGHEAFPYRCAVALAERLGLPLTPFPGGHAGFVTHPRAFTRQLLTVLANGPAR
ncbi:alpha/beta hydrolase [Asanoa sp. NPDC049573]|uniref:alpha/beta fold hydrolase n=1 Tax=Asanoa sp. NPDC049573 TaxID=3155396 RepID=UPI003423E533